MDKIIVTGGKPLIGHVKVSGSKNAALPLMAASLLTAEDLSLSNLPHLVDISTMANLLAQHGVCIKLDGSDNARSGYTGSVMVLNAANINNFSAPYDIVRKMRASVLVLGPLLARYGEAKVSLPGGCAIGTRPIDLHLKAFEQMGAHIELEEGYIKASAKNGLKGAEILFDKVSVGATENILMAASIAQGTTIIQNAAREPEVVDLANCLVSMGADITGIGSDTITIKGKTLLHGCNYKVIPDRIEAGSYMVAAAMTNGDIIIEGADIHMLGAVVEKLHKSGVEVYETPEGIKVKRSGANIEPVDIITHPYPGFPTDMQAQFMVLMTIAKGVSVIKETIFENRFMHVSELHRMGADIKIDGTTAIIKGVDGLKAAQVMATDLRASISLILAGLAAEGDTILNRVYHLDRGYERIEEKLCSIGAMIKRVR